MTLMVETNKFWQICESLGMSNDARLGWAELHSQPHLICLAHFASMAAFCLSASVLYGVGLPWPTLVMQVPFIFSTSAVLIMSVLIWHGGPWSAETLVCRIVMAACGTSNLFVIMASVVGPRRLVPFGSQLLNLVGTACMMFSAFAASALGANPADHPPQPYTTFFTPLMSATFSTVRCIDIMTDLGFARILLQQGPECTWFGAPVPCSRYTRLGIAAACKTGVTTLLVFAVAMLAGQQTLLRSTGNMFKVAVTANAAIMLCELGGVTITALKLFSDMRRPCPDAAAAARLRREAAFALTSALLTIASFCINVFGMRRIVAMLRAAVTSVQERLWGSAIILARGSAIMPTGGCAVIPSGRSIIIPSGQSIVMPSGGSAIVPTDSVLILPDDGPGSAPTPSPQKISVPHV